MILEFLFLWTAVNYCVRLWNIVGNIKCLFDFEIYIGILNWWFIS